MEQKKRCFGLYMRLETILRGELRVRDMFMSYYKEHVDYTDVEDYKKDLMNQ